jgi:hypothetical protein
MNSQPTEPGNRTIAMNTIAPTEVRQERVHRRLGELEVAAGLGDGPELAWHIAQAARCGASLTEVLKSVNAGMKMRGTSVASLTQCADMLMQRAFGVRSRLRRNRRTGFEAPSSRCRHRSGRCS